MASDQIEDQPVVVVDNVELGYGRIPVLSGVQMEVRQGDFWCFIGPNGEGKTTLIKALLGAVRPRRGQIALRSDFMKRTRIGFVPQESELNPAVSTTVQEFIACGMIGLPIDSSTRCLRLDQSMKLMEILRFRDRRIWELSGGQRQRALIARALVRDPLMMIVDEPTAGLDFAAAAGLLETITQLNKEKGITVIFVTHDLDIAANHSSHVALFRGGRALTGPTRECLTSDNLTDTFGVSMEVTWLTGGGASIRSRFSPAEHTESLRETFLQEQIQGAPQESGIRSKNNTLESSSTSVASVEGDKTRSENENVPLSFKISNSENSPDAFEEKSIPSATKPELQGVGSLDALLVRMPSDEDNAFDAESQLGGEDRKIETSQQDLKKTASSSKSTKSTPTKKASVRKSSGSGAKSVTKTSSNKKVAVGSSKTVKKKKAPPARSSSGTRKTDSSSGRTRAKSASTSKSKSSSAKTAGKIAVTSIKKKPSKSSKSVEEGNL